MKTKQLNNGDGLDAGCRSVSLREAAEGAAPGLDTDARTLALTFSSEKPVARWFGEEVLSHDAGAADLTRLNDGAPLLFNHNMNDVRGVVESAAIGTDGRGHAVVRFAHTPAGDEAMAMVGDGILRNVSIMYQVSRYVVTAADGDGEADTYRATQWEPFEISLVAVPADPTVGVGRARMHEYNRPVVVERDEIHAASAVHTEAQAMRRSYVVYRAPDDGSGAPVNPSTVKAAPAAPVVSAPPIDQDKIRSAARLDEQTRIRALTALARKHEVPEATLEKWVTDAVSIEAARGLTLEMISERGAKPVANFDHQRVELSASEQRQYSIVRAINACASGNWQHAGFEREVSGTIARNVGRDPRQNAFYMPSNLPFAPSPDHLRALAMGGSRYAQRMMTRASYTVGTAAAGGDLVGTTLMADSFIEVLRNMSVTALLGARYLTGLVGDVDIPRQTSETPTYWVGESGAVTEGEAAFDKVSLTPKTIGALSKMSRKALMQTTPAIEMLAREDMLAALALGVDQAVLRGSGSSNQPTGIMNQSNVGSVIGGTNGASLSFDHLIQLYSKPAISNAPLANLAFAMNAKSKGYLASQKASGSGVYLWTPGGGAGGAVSDVVQGYTYAVSNQLRSNLTKGTATTECSELIFGNWREVLVGEWGTIEVMVNPYDSTGFAAGDVLIRAFQSIDVTVRHGASFAAMSDALTPGF